MPDMKQILEFVGIGLSALNVLFSILSLALPSWTSYGNNGSGLWKTCAGSVCISWSIVSGWFDAVRAFMFLGVFALIAVLVVAILYAFVMKDKQILLFVTIGLAFVAGFCLMIAFAVYADKTVGGNYGAAFALCVIGWLLSWGIAALYGAIYMFGRNSSPS